MKNLTMTFECTDEQYAQIKAYFKVDGGGPSGVLYKYDMLYYGVHGLLRDFYEEVEDGLFSQEEIESFNKEYERIMKKFRRYSKVKP